MKNDATNPFSPASVDDDELLPEYDFRGGVRGKYAAHFPEGTSLVSIEPDLARRNLPALDSGPSEGE